MLNLLKVSLNLILQESYYIKYEYVLKTEMFSAYYYHTVTLELK